MSLTQALTRDANGVTFADPTDPDFTVRFKTKRSNKGLSGINVENYLTEIIINDDHDLVVGTASAVEALSVRIRVSGSAKSQPRLLAMLASICGQVPVWGAENVFLGFEPTTVPINPPAAY